MNKNSRSVITAFGRLTSRKNCRWIRGKYYITNKECVRVKNQWHRIDNGKVGYDMVDRKWKLISDIPTNYKKVLIEIDEETKYPSYGFRPVDKYDDVEVARDFEGTLHGKSITNLVKNSSIPEVYRKIMNSKDSREVKELHENSDLSREEFYSNLREEVKELITTTVSDPYFLYYCYADEKEIRDTHTENPQDGVYYLTSELGPRERDLVKKKGLTFRLRNYGMEYTTVGNRQENLTKDSFKQYISRFVDDDTSYVIGTEMGVTSFGIEYETSSGFIPERRLPGAGLIPLRDGSLDGGLEYTTIPMKGINGIKGIFHQCELLERYTNINDLCSLHIHFGSIPKNKQFVMRMYKLLKTLEEEFYSLYPSYKKVGRDGANKSYCQPLPKFDKFNALYDYISGGLTHPSGSKIVAKPVREHPQGANKWNRNGRYHWFNFEPMFFGPGTVEFRLPTPTKNAHKVLPTLLLIKACINVAISEEEATTLKEVVEKGLNFEQTKNIVLDYLEFRKKVVKKSDSIELREDHQYNNKYINV
jgi:hypothetical protein